MNRHLRGDMLPIIGKVPDSVVVGAGDLVLISRGGRDLNRGLLATSGLTGYVYPWASGATTNTHVQGQFAGVAMTESAYGTTSDITISTAGVFEFPLLAKAGVTIGKLVAVLPTGFSQKSQTTASYTVSMTAAVGCSIGWVYKTESSASKVTFLLRSSYGPGGLASQN